MIFIDLQIRFYAFLIFNADNSTFHSKLNHRIDKNNYGTHLM